MVYDYNESTGESEQNSIDTINKNILDMFESSPQSGTFYNDIVEDINLNDVNRYFNNLQEDKNLPFKEPRFKEVRIEKIEDFALICDYSNVHNIEYPLYEEQRVYFIESADYAISVIPIQLDRKFLSVHIAPLEDAPPFLLEMYNKKRKMDLNDIKFVKPTALKKRK